MKDTPPIIDKKLKISNYWENIKDDYENIIFCTGGGPFEKDYSDNLMKNIILFTIIMVTYLEWDI